MINLEKHIKEQRLMLDSDLPREGHEERFRQKLGRNAAAVPERRFKLRHGLQIAASIAIGLGGGSLVRDDGGRIGPDSVGYELTEKALVFGGDTVGMFRAFDDETGEILWEIDLESPVSGYPVSFAVDGKQYIAVAAGSSLVASSMNRLTPEIGPESSAPMLHVFALP